MRQLMIFAVVFVVLGGVAARYADQAVSSPPQQAAVVQPAYEPREATTSGRSLMLEADRLGHFQVEATVDRIQVGGITVYDVPAMVLPDEALAKNLLGVSFLSRLKRYEYANGRIVLEQ